MDNIVGYLQDNDMGTLLIHDLNNKVEREGCLIFKGDSQVIRETVPIFFFLLRAYWQLGARKPRIVARTRLHQLPTSMHQPRTIRPPAIVVASFSTFLSLKSKSEDLTVR